MSKNMPVIASLCTPLITRSVCMQLLLIIENMILLSYIFGHIIFNLHNTLCYWNCTYGITYINYLFCINIVQKLPLNQAQYSMIISNCAIGKAHDLCIFLFFLLTVILNLVRKLILCRLICKPYYSNFLNCQTITFTSFYWEKSEKNKFSLVLLDITNSFKMQYWFSSITRLKESSLVLLLI